MKAIWNNAVIEGNQYFPPSSVHREYLVDSDTHATCVWKGEASYYTLMVDGQENADAAWYYPAPKDGSIEKVGHDFTDYVTFWRGVEVTK
ncbi:MAG TPA: DUF427 domain-containing protein [Candidatus Saccharimonadia bacterium]|nr:DUF427 domain-containing protein [Candidatus Saccharimonadia bacterium]